MKHLGNIFLIAALGALYFNSLAFSGQGITVISDEKISHVRALIFSSSQCELCSGVKAFARSLERRMPVSFKILDIEKPRNYKIFDRLEEIHGVGDFAVPMIIVGEQTLIGEAEIKAKLERSIRRLSTNGGAKLPYLGMKKRRAAQRPRQRKPEDCGCDRDRPPSVEEELARLGKALDWLF